MFRRSPKIVTKLTNSAMKQTNKMVIYQVFPRWFGNMKSSLVKNGSKVENGIGKFSDFTPVALSKIKELGTTHVWYTGVIEHATNTDYTAYQIRRDHAAVVKGNAGSPYAIKDYYDIDPDLADNVPDRMKEFESLVRRTHEAGMKVIIDFVPNHVARQYYSDAKMAYVEDLGQKDNTSKAFDPNNNFYYIPGQTLRLQFGAQQEDFEYSEFPAKVTGNDCFSTCPGQNDWYETVKLNYGVDYMNGRTPHFDPVPNTWTKMLDILLYWADKGVDGFRCDTAKHVDKASWNQLKQACVSALREWRSNNKGKAGADWKEDFWMTGEHWDHGVGYDTYYSEGGFDSMINFAVTGGGALASGSVASTYQGYADKINTREGYFR